MDDHDRILIPYKQAIPLIKEADILLFRNTTILAKLIQGFTQSQYDHAALASNNCILEIIEFRPNRGGGASVAAEIYLQTKSGKIDVYRPSNHYDSYYYDKESNSVKQSKIVLNHKAVTNTMRSLTGLPYGWRRAWWIAKKYLMWLNLFYNVDDLTSDDREAIIYPVCSTAIAYSFNQSGFDLIKNLGDKWNTPKDISESPLIHYLFTIV